MKTSIVVIIAIAVVIIAIVGFLFTLELFSSNNTTKITNGNVNVTTANGNTVNNTTVSNQSKNNSSPPQPHDISPEKARELAKKYVGPGTLLGKPVKTTYKRIHVWQVPVYTRDHKFINNIYIDAKTGKKVD